MTQIDASSRRAPVPSPQPPASAAPACQVRGVRDAVSRVSRARDRRPPTARVPSAATSQPGPPSWLAGLAVGVLLVGAGGTWWMWSRQAVGARPAQPNVLLITLDTTRADRLGSYGYTAAATPHLDRLAAGGVRFAQAVSPAPLTLPAHASLFTGRNPFAHGVRNNGYFVLAGRRADAGGALRRRRLRHRRLRQLVRPRPTVRSRPWLRALRRRARSAGRGGRLAGARASRRPYRWRRPLAWLAARAASPSRPYFLWVHLYDAHDPYRPPAAFVARFEQRPYDGEIAFQDVLVGELLTRAGHGTAASPLVVVAGDHGESLGEHGESTHGLFVYEGALRVPLIVSWPGVIGPRVVTPVVSLVDVAPTVTALAGLAPLEGSGRPQPRAAHRRRRHRRDRDARCLRRDLLPAVLHGMGAPPLGARGLLEVHRRARAGALRSGARSGRAHQRLRRPSRPRRERCDGPSRPWRARRPTGPAQRR